MLALSVYSKSNRRCHFLKRPGMTLIEMIMAIIILGILVGITAAFSFVMLNTIGLITTQGNLQENANVALSRMSREIRRLKDDQSIATANASELSFVDRDNITITYRRTGTVLERLQSSPASTNGLADLLLNGAGGLIITYYGEDPNVTDGIPAPELGSPTFGLGTKTNVRRIEIRLKFMDGSNTLNAQTTVRPRSLRHESYFLF